MLNLAEILAALSEVGERFLVERWRIGEIHVWPLVRYEVASSNFELTARPTAPDSTTSRLGQLASWGRAALRAPENVIPPAVDVLVYSDGVSYLGAYDRFADPVCAFASERGLTSHVLVPFHRYVAAPGPSTYVQPAIDAVQVVASAASRLRLDRELELPGFAAAMDLLRSRGATRLPGVEALARTARQTQVHARFLQTLLRRTRPRVALLPSYIGTERMALALACRRLRIPCVDIQHGAAGETHWAYGGFQRAPAEGYELMPDRFWCWSEADADAIRRWGGDRHEAIVAGAPMIEAWRRGLVPGAAEARRALETRRPAGGPEVCFILSGYETPELLDAYCTCIKASPNYFFWFRTHPLRLAQGKGLEARLAAASLSNRAEVSLSTQAPLYALLERVQALVMELSSTAYEGAMFGVQSLLTSESTATVYEDLVRAGYARHAAPAELAHRLRELPPQRPAWGPGPKLVDQGVDRLLSAFR